MTTAGLVYSFLWFLAKMSTKSLIFILFGPTRQQDLFFGSVFI